MSNSLSIWGQDGSIDDFFIIILGCVYLLNPLGETVLLIQLYKSNKFHNNSRRITYVNFFHSFI